MRRRHSRLLAQRQGRLQLSTNCRAASGSAAIKSSATLSGAITSLIADFAGRIRPVPACGVRVGAVRASHLARRRRRSGTPRLGTPSECTGEPRRLATPARSAIQEGTPLATTTG